MKKLVGYKSCENCYKTMPIKKYYEQKRFCSAKCRAAVVPMPEYTPFFEGHTPWNKGIKWPELSKARMGSDNPAWKGNAATYSSIHQWVNSKLEKPKMCSCCRKSKRLFLSNISYEYRRDLTDWEYLCQSCHIKKDYHSGNWGAATRKFKELQKGAK